jgi:peptidoglycan/LPS O-acetylase OafA/YrhL
MAENRYIKSLDGVRAIAIVLVMSLHTGIMHFGWLGVQLFFVLSGYLITGILWKEKDRSAPVFQKVKKFWVRRALRIFPLYFGYLFVLGITYLLFHFPESYRTYMPYLMSYTYNFTRTISGWKLDPAFAHLWSLAIEEQFYLLFPLILLLSPRRFIPIFMVLVIAITPLSRYLLAQYYSHQGFRGEALATIVYWNTLSHLDAFFMGGLIPVLSLDKLIKKPHFVLLGAVALALMAGIWNFATQSQHNFYLTDFGYSFGHTENYVYVWQYSVLDLLFAGLLLVLVSDHCRNVFPRLKKVLENKWFVNVGRVSYGMYIYHWLIWFYLFENWIKPQNVFMKVSLFIPYVALLYLVASVSYKYYEAPFIRLKDHYFPGAGAAAAEKKAPARA